LRDDFEHIPSLDFSSPGCPQIHAKGVNQLDSKRFMAKGQTFNPAPTATDAEIDCEAHQLPIEIIVKRLVEIAGIVVTGSVGGVKDERAVRCWIAKDRHPERELQLRFAYRIAKMIAGACGPHVVQAWFKGSNTSLSDRAPALLLRDDFSDETQQAILSAVRRLRQ